MTNIVRSVNLLVATAAMYLVCSCTYSNSDIESIDTSIMKGTWLAHDGDEKLCGQLALRVTQDSAYFGNRVFADGRPDSLAPVATVLRLTKDSLFLDSKHRYECYAWKLTYLDKERLILTGDSYSYEFIKQNKSK